MNTSTFSPRLNEFSCVVLSCIVIVCVCERDREREREREREVCGSVYMRETCVCVCVYVYVCVGVRAREGERKSFFNGFISHKTRKLTHTTVQGNSLFNVMSQENCEYKPACNLNHLHKCPGNSSGLMHWK